MCSRYVICVSCSVHLNSTYTTCAKDHRLFTRPRLKAGGRVLGHVLLGLSVYSYSGIVITEHAVYQFPKEQTL